ncbi:hypothetical protein K1T71_008403 [Dendrolimus kikuchii]|uniref:Uncharacterized protein n=1 Tax=Dendrolimus kikuchii TaxID=765133 RepID=A0ACC1CXK5_9NEOP|nr:hypothetical protein K1T71_008403 [Dendrolimus kikuchii]
MSKITFTINGMKCIVDERTPRTTTLNAYIRYVCGLPGTKAMCREGGCGACIVSVRATRYPNNQVEIFPVNSCLVLIFSCDGWEITTVEGVGNRLDGYNIIQKRIVLFDGSQCGYCTPGWVMQMFSLLHKHLPMFEIERSFGSNTCRCTGFRSIMDAMKSFAIDASPNLCQRVKQLNDIEDLNGCKRNNCSRKCSIRSDDSDWCFLDDHVNYGEVISLNFGKCKFFKVFEQNDIFDILKKHGVDSYMLADGNTGKGIVESFEYPNIIIDISDVRSLKQYKFDQNLILRANLSLESCITIFTNVSAHNSDFSYLSEFAAHLKLVAHIPVRTLGSLAGNMIYKHKLANYPSDVFLLFETVGATMTVRTLSGSYVTLTMMEFLKYDMSGVLIVHFALPPLCAKTHCVRTYKIMPRNQNALAIVNAGFLLKFDSKNIVRKATIVYGNIRPDFVHAVNTENYLLGKNISRDDTLQGSVKMLEKEVLPTDNPPEASVECRKKLAIGLFYKFVLNITSSSLLLPMYRSGSILLQRPVSSGKQDYQTDPSLYPVNQPIPKLEGIIQSAGEAQYANDVPPMKREVFGAFVLSTVSSGQVEKIDAADVLAINGVVAMYTPDDIPGKNSFTFPGIQLQTEIEQTLATDIKFYGQPIAIIVAEREELATTVAKKVKVTYKNVKSTPPVLRINDAKKDRSRYIEGDSTLEPTGKGTDVKKVIKGVYEIEAQYHYYMEPISCVVIPVDKGLEVHDATQWMDLTQISIAKFLNMKESDIIVKVNRIGGGFGGKISRSAQVATACALVARKLDRPCRFILPMQTNLTIAGKRLPCQVEYEVGVNDDGKIQYLNGTLVEDVGCSNNENILSYAVESFPNSYDASYFSLKSATVLTDLPSNTFARAPGTAEGISSIEHIMEHIAFELKKDPTSVRLANMKSTETDLPELIESFKTEVNFDERYKEIQQFNANNRWRKRAIKISIMSFPVIYFGNYSAAISIYRGDGTVSITTAGIEMGQGVNTKAAQVCARELGIPLDYVSVNASYSFTACNCVFSGSSITTESVCYAIIKICAEINKRLAYLKALYPNLSWPELIMKAGDEEVDLFGFFMMTDKEKDLNGYNAYAVAILELELDVLTGRYLILRVDILEDVGISINPNLDVGQVEGGYVQGLGYFTTEKLVYDKKTGKLLTNRSLTYHVPLCQDIPIQFNVKLRYNSKNPNGVLGSKTCGEMGICTSHGITHAIRDCIMASRKDSGYDVNEWVNLDVPVDTEVILKALDVKYEEFLLTK